MKTVDQIADEMAKEGAERIHEGEALIRMSHEVRTCKYSSFAPTEIKAKEHSIEKYPGYDAETKELLPKILPIENVEKKIWTLKEVTATIKGVEGAKKSHKALTNFNHKIGVLVSAKEIYSVKLGGSMRYTYYFTNKEWMYRTLVNGVPRVRIKDEFFFSESVKNLKDFYHDQNRLVWDSDNDPNSDESIPLT